MTQHQHAHAGPGPYLVELLYATSPEPSAQTVAEALRRHFPKVDEEAEGGLSWRVGTDDAEGRISLGITAGLARPDDLKAAIDQTWDWPEAPARAGAAKATVTLAVEAPGGLARALRLNWVHAAIESVSGAAGRPLALHWLPSQRLVDPEAWRQSVSHGAPPSDHALNVRLFKVADGRPGEGLMDTRGLAALGLPDLQCHFVDLELDAVARLLFAYAEYLFEKGDVLNEESLVRGVASYQEWEVQRGTSLSAPEREVVMLLPDPANRPS